MYLLCCGGDINLYICDIMGNGMIVPKKLLMAVGIIEIAQLAAADTENKLWYAVIIGCMCIVYKLVQIFKK